MMLDAAMILHSLRVRNAIAAIVAIALLFIAPCLLGQTPPPPTTPPASPATAPPPGSSSLDQAADLIDRPISAVRLEGLARVSRQEVANNIRAAVGEPFDIATVKNDVARLNRLGEFKYVDAVAELQPDGSVNLIYKFVEQQMINEVQVVGNKLIADQDLLAVVQLVPKGPRDDFLIQNAKRGIETLYRKRGHYLTTVTIDETELSKGILLFRVTEGPRVKVRAIEFQGNQAFTEDQLYPEIKTRTAIFIFRKGELDEEQLTDDVASLDRYYKDRGYLDVRVDREIELSPDNTEAKVVFLIAEGDRYTLRFIQVSNPAGKPLKVFAPEQIAAILELKSGDVYSRDLLNKSIKAVKDSYGLMGYLPTEEERAAYGLQDWNVYVKPTVLRVGDQPQVDLLLEIAEGRQFNVGVLEIQGNFLTRDKVIRREVRGLNPGRLYDGTEIEKTTDRLMRTRLFNDVRITVQKEEQRDDAGGESQTKPDSPDNPSDQTLEPSTRDILIEVKEKNTGSVNFGVAVGSDSGIFGELSLVQNNFDVSDFPESLQELFAGRAFRGAGQKFNATLRPGTELFQYAMSITEPHLLDSDYALTVGGQFRTRVYQRYDEERFGGNVSIGRQFGDIWNIALQSRIEQITLSKIDPESPTEIFEDKGPDLLTDVGISLTRTTITTFTRPGKGSRLQLSLDHFGSLGGDFDFTTANAEYTVYFTVDEDFLGRISTIKLTSRVGYIFGGRAPTYERFYLGGRSFRGFDFRTISPKGTRADNGLASKDPVGGEWEFFVGSQYEFPIFGDALTGVAFMDTGTVQDHVGFDEYRVSVGAGIRLYIPQFGEVPIAFDFGFPLLKNGNDKAQLFSFSAELPF